MFPKFLTSFLHTVTYPKSKHEDTQRREFILNVLLVSVIALLLIGTAIDIFNIIADDPVSRANNSLSLLVILAILALFLILYALSRSGLHMIASYSLLGILFFLATHMGYRWGIDLHAVLFLYVLVVVTTGILISTRAAFGVTLLVSGAIFTVGTLQQNGTIEANRYWAEDIWVTTDFIMISVLFLIIATVSWLSNREIEKSLARARKSEAALKEERDMLEVRVEKRTKELRRAEEQRIQQAYRFVEFGRIAGGLFHDLINPLTALSLNVDRIARTPKAENGDAIETLHTDVHRAQQAMGHMQKLMDSMRKHLAREDVYEAFSVSQALMDIREVLRSYARKNGVTLQFDILPEVTTHGNSVAFTQVISNLISNAIDAYAPVPYAEHTTPNSRIVFVTLSRNNDMITIEVRDHGVGIPEDVRGKIFEPFFSTKSAEQGVGIGLSLTKRIVEKDFGGELSVDSTVGAGSTFRVYFPVRGSRAPLSVPATHGANTRENTGSI